MIGETLFLEAQQAGVELEAEGGKIHWRAENGIPTQLKQKLTEHRAELLRFLASRQALAENRLSDWPPESLDAERKFGGVHARLYPFLGRSVRTPYGHGKLFRVFRDSAAVVIFADNDDQKLIYLDPLAVLPILPNGSRTERRAADLIEEGGQARGR